MINGHRIYLTVLTLLVAGSLVVLIKTGFDYYRLPLEERFFHENYNFLKPGGDWGHGIGIIGSLFMIIGVIIYSGRKRIRSMSRLGILKHWLEFHIFLCTLGPILILFHTSFKFGGIVAVSFWSMVAVFVSGILGRFIYIQIPRTIEGRELSLAEVREYKEKVAGVIDAPDEETKELIREVTKKRVELYHENFFIRNYRRRRQKKADLKRLRQLLRTKEVNIKDGQKIMHLVRQEISLNGKIERLTRMQQLFRYWHVAHIPFAIVMLIIMIIHVAVTIVLGYRWIF